MIRILVISDTHGHNAFIEKEISSIGEENIHAIIHAGDCVEDAEMLSYTYPNIPMYNVAGNNDMFSTADDDKLITLGGVKIFITHGHGYRVKYDSDFETLLRKAQAVGADIAVFGHTHCTHLSYHGKLILLNPGSAGYSDRYAVIEIEDGKAKAKLI